MSVKTGEDVRPEEVTNVQVEGGNGTHVDGRDGVGHNGGHPEDASHVGAQPESVGSQFGADHSIQKHSAEAAGRLADVGHVGCQPGGVSDR